MKTKLTAAYVIGYDGDDHVIYRNGEVVYDHDRIEFVGHGYVGPVDRTIDAGLSIVSPGFIDLDALAISTTLSWTHGCRRRLGWAFCGRPTTFVTGDTTSSRVKKRRSSIATP